jgi:hypothetical protein
MSLLSVELDSLCTGSQRLGAKGVYLPHKDKIQLVLSRNLSKLPIPSDQKIPFELRLEPAGPVLLLNGKEVPCDDARRVKEVARIIDYYRNTGLLEERGTISSPQAKAETQKCLDLMRKTNVPGASERWNSGLHITDDTVSLVRSLIFAVSPLGNKDPVGVNLGYLTGALGTFFALQEIYSGRREISRAREIGDSEGLRRARTRLLFGSVVITASSTHLVGRILKPVAAPIVSAGLQVAAEALFAAGSFIHLATSTLGAVRCYRFNARLNEYLNNPHLTEEQKLQGALKFLKDHIYVTTEEQEQIRIKVEEQHPNVSEFEREELIRKAIQNRVEVKLKFLKRRTSNKSLYLIFNRVDKVLEKIGNPQTRLEGILEASILIDKIQRENKTKFTLYALSMLAALLGVLGMVCFIFCPALTALPYALYGVAGMLYFGMTVYTAFNFIKFEREQDVLEKKENDMLCEDGACAANS